jgi:hypothetical protein
LWQDHGQVNLICGRDHDRVDLIHDQNHGRVNLICGRDRGLVNSICGRDKYIYDSTTINVFIHYATKILFIFSLVKLLFLLHTCHPLKMQKWSF